MSPSYVELVRQLSAEDAKTLEILDKANRENFSIIEFRININNSQFFISQDLPYVVTLRNESYIEIERKVIDNLERLGIVQIYDDKTIPVEEQLCKKIFYKYSPILKKKTVADKISEASISYAPMMMSITSYGKDFLDICFQ